MAAMPSRFFVREIAANSLQCVSWPFFHGKLITGTTVAALPASGGQFMAGKLSSHSSFWAMLTHRAFAPYKQRHSARTPGSGVNSTVVASLVEALEEDAVNVEAARIDAIADWIGRAHGRGAIHPSAPDFDVAKHVKTWEADGRLATREIRILKLLGSGLAGTVFLAQDEHGTQFIEKHYGEVPAKGSKKLGRFLTATIFTFFRQAPLSFRELPEAVIANHLTNRFIVELSRRRFGRSLTPPLLFTRYDEQTGGYVQAFTFVEGRPLRPWEASTTDGNLPLLGEAGLFYRTMQHWRDFLAKELGFWGLARQVDPANPNSYSNVWITPDKHALLLDVVPGVPGFLEGRYLWWGLWRGQLPPFSDAIDFRRLETYLSWQVPYIDESWGRDLALLRAAVMRWQNSEPRIWSSPFRLWRVLTDATVRGATRQALLTHLEVKGAISARQAVDYRVLLSSTGRFPRLSLHSILKMAPLRLHLLLTDSAYARRAVTKILRRGWRLPLRVVATIVLRLGRALVFVLKQAGYVWLLLTNRQERLERCHTEVGRWIEEEHELGRLPQADAARLRAELHSDREIADLGGLFAIHVAISALKQSVVGPSGAWMAMAIVTRNWWWAAPTMIAPVLRVIALLWLGLGNRLGLLFFSALPDVGVLAAPLYLLQRRALLGGFILRAFGRKVALKIPGFGERGSMAEMVGVAAAQVFMVDPGRMLPLVLVAALLGLLKHWLWLSGTAILVYFVAVLFSVIRRWPAPNDAPEASDWAIGLPER